MRQKYETVCFQASLNVHGTTAPVKDILAMFSEGIVYIVLAIH